MMTSSIPLNFALVRGQFDSREFGLGVYPPGRGYRLLR
jgi:hypothetical protein